MTMLNEFLKTVSMRADDNDELYAILREFLEPDTDDKKIHGGTVIRTVFMTFHLKYLHNFRAEICRFIIVFETTEKSGLSPMDL